MQRIAAALRLGLFVSLVLGPWLYFQPAASRVAAPHEDAPAAQNIIVLIADGWGYRHLEATESYSGDTPGYRQWAHFAMATFPLQGAYDPNLAWSDFTYVLKGPTDSAAAATAMFTGHKTQNGRISTDASGGERLFSLAEKARSQGQWVGVVTSVYLSHATPGAWYAHNTARANGFAIADEGLWGDPNTTGTPLDDPRYGGGLGPTYPPLQVLVGAGHPAWNGGSYVNPAIRDRLAAEAGNPGAFAFVERIPGSPDGGPRLLSTAALSTTTRLAGLFGGTGGSLEWRTADGSGLNPENPTLAEMAQAALTVLQRSPQGFVLLIEGGAVDWAGHANHMDHMVGELLGFDEAFQVVAAWVSDPANGSSWENTLVVVTGDHETGYLSAGPGIFPDQSLGEVSPYTLGLEKAQVNTALRASWEDLNDNGLIDPDETVYWAWNSTGHTNSLIPLFARGPGVHQLAAQVIGTDPVRGLYVDNTAVHALLGSVLSPVNRLQFLPIVTQGS